MRGRVLVIAGSDSGGGAGIQADIKTLTALGAYAATAVTALTAQDTLSVHEIMPVPPAFIARQISVVLDDIGVDAIKLGMLGESDAIEVVAACLSGHSAVPLVLDPVMVAKGGTTLAGTAAVAAMKRRLIPMAALITPNVPEAEVLAGRRIPDLATLRDVAASLLTLGAAAVLLKGGHLLGEMVVDVLATPEAVEAFEAPRINTRHTHGTGCTLASAIAAGLAQGMELRDAVRRARAYVQAAIEAAPGFGAGHGPLDHSVKIDF